jgi:3-deoxy-manno-octulosonate cytidylyltransferase (CMP-KDO synthetase)
MSVLVVIPARYGSTRFPGKPLATIRGKPMIQHVYEGAAKAKGIDEVIVATDDERIVRTVIEFGGKAAMTNPACRSGTERVAEVARTRSASVIINVQGDEPLVQPDMLEPLAEFLSRHQAVPMASLMTRLRLEDRENPSVVKVVVDRDGFALYFSRSPIPYSRVTLATSHQPLVVPLFKHLGLYGYQRHFLLQFPSLEPTPLEQVEQLEQLRVLEHGYRLKLLETAHDTIGVDTPADIGRVEALMAQVVKTLDRVG